MLAFKNQKNEIKQWKKAYQRSKLITCFKATTWKTVFQIHMFIEIRKKDKMFIETTYQQGKIP